MKQLFASISNFRQPRSLRRSETMKAKLLLLCVALASAPLMSAQINCLPNNYQGKGPLVCQFPISGLALANLFGGVSNNSSFAQSLITTASATSATINASVGAQLSQLPQPSAAVGTVNLRSSASDPGTPFDNLGPVLTDRPDTVPFRHVFLSFAYQHFNFTDIDGLSFNGLNVGFSAPVQVFASNGSGRQVAGTFYGTELNKISFQLDQYLGILTFGLPRSTDVSVVVPINSVSTQVTTSNFQAYVYSTAYSASNPYIPLVLPNTPQTSTVTSGSATGIGDVTVNFKHMFVGEETPYAISAGAQLRFPTGDSSNYLGSGTSGAEVYALFEYRKRYKKIGVAPHAKLGYQWNGASQIMDITSKPTQSLPGGFDYALGADFGLYHHKFTNFTISLDGVGHEYVNAPDVVASSLTLPKGTTATPGITIPSTLPVTAVGNNTYATANFSGGFKYQFSKYFLVYGNVLVPINNVGLHSDPVPLVGIAFKM